jgi:hypothetical protein
LSDIVTQKSKTTDKALEEGNAEAFAEHFTANDLGDKPWYIGYAITNNFIDIFLIMATVDERGEPIHLARTFQLYCQEADACPEKLSDIVRQLFESHKERALTMLEALHEHEIPALEIELDGKQTLLHLAAVQNYESIEDAENLVAFLQQHIKSTQDAEGNTPLHLAASDQKNPRLLAQLATESAKAVQNSEGNTPTHIGLIAKRSEQDVRILMNGEANLLANNSGNLPLHYALMQERSPKFIAEVAESVDPLQPNKEGMRPLHFAREMREVHCAQNSIGEECLYWLDVKRTLETLDDKGLHSKQEAILSEEERRVQKLQARIEVEKEADAQKLLKLEEEKRQAIKELEEKKEEEKRLKLEELSKKSEEHEEALKERRSKAQELKARLRRER